METNVNEVIEIESGEVVFWEISESFIQDLNIQDVGLIEDISLYLEGKMNAMLANVKLKNLSPQESYEYLQESIWEEIKPMLSEKSPA